MSDPKMTTTDGRAVDEVRAEQQAEGNVMHKSYIVLSDEERAKGFVRPVRRSYRHVGIAGPKLARALEVPTDRVVTVNSGTSALHLAYVMAGIIEVERLPNVPIKDVISIKVGLIKGDA